MSSVPGLPFDWYASRRVASVAGVPRECVEAEACLVNGLLVNIDGYSAGESKPHWISWKDWGWRALAAALSDVVASGGEPFAAAVSLGVRSVDVALEVMAGVAEAAARYEVVVAKGDLNKAESDEWIDVAVVGKPLRWVTRVGAAPGDVLIQVGELGYGGLAQAVTDRRIPLEALDRRVVERAARPLVSRGFGVVASECGVKAAIDNSDGWAFTLAQLAEASGVTVNIDHVVVADEVRSIVEQYSLGSVEEFGLYSWEDYNIAAVVGRESVDCALDLCGRLGLKCWLVGEVVSRGTGLVTFRGKPVKIIGWSRFTG